MSEKIFYRTYGKGTPFIFIHGLYGSSDNWITFSKPFASHFQVILPDLRNHGASFHAKEFNYDVMCQDLLKLIHHLGVSKVILLGHSMGGKLAMYFSSKYPEMIDQLIIIDVAPRAYHSLNNPSKEMTYHLNILSLLKGLDVASLQSLAHADTKLAETVSDERTRQFLLKNLRRITGGGYSWKINLESIFDNFFNLFSEIEFLPFQRFHFPTLFIKGDRSKYINDDDVAYLSRFYENSSFVVIPDAGHWVQADNPTDVYNTISDFVNSPFKKELGSTKQIVN